MNVITMPDVDLWDIIEQDGNTCYSNLSGKSGAKQLKMLSKTNDTNEIYKPYIMNVKVETDFTEITLRVKNIYLQQLRTTLIRDPNKQMSFLRGGLIPSNRMWNKFDNINEKSVLVREEQSNVH